MMRGNGWYGNSNCSFLGNGMFGGWTHLVILGAIIVIVALVLWYWRKNNGKGTQALNTLKELYVKGEITEEEYLKRKNVIAKWHLDWFEKVTYFRLKHIM